MVSTSYIQAGQGQLLCAVIVDGNGQAWDLTSYCHCLRVYESVCKEYITAQMIFYDSDNIIENLNIQAGTPAGFAFWSPPNNFLYSAGTMGPNFSNMTGSYGTLAVLKMKGEQAKDSLKYSIYTIDFIGSVWYQNMNTQVQYTGTGTGTQLITNIWNQYLASADANLNVLSSSIGQIGSPQQAHVTAGEKPITAIHNIMREMISVESSQLSNWLLFKNRSGVNLAQLPSLFATNNINGPTGFQPPQNNAQGQQEYFVQKEAWGAGSSADGTGGVNDPFIYHAIIALQAEAREGTGSGGVSSGLNMAGTTNTQQFVQDIASGNIVTQPLQSLGVGTTIGGIFSVLGSLVGLGAAAGAGASIIGNQITNSTIWPNATAPFTKTPGEAGYSGAVKGAAQLVMKVPLQTGINVTVGLGIYAYLLPGGVFSTAGSQIIDNLSGPWLVTDLVHELYTDQRQNACTTVLQLNQGPQSGSGLGGNS